MGIFKSLTNRYYHFYKKYIIVIHLLTLIFGTIDTFLLYSLELGKPLKYLKTPHFFQALLIVPMLIICIFKRAKLFCFITSIERITLYLATFFIPPVMFNPLGLFFSEGQFLITIYGFIISKTFDCKSITELINILEPIKEDLSIMLISIVFVANYGFLYVLIKAELEYLKEVRK